jgi:hypothetical protein
MKAWFVAILAGMLGAAVAVGSVWRDFSVAEASYDSLRTRALPSGSPRLAGEPEAGQPRLVLEGEP